MLLTFLQTLEPLGDCKTESYSVFTAVANTNRSQASPVRTEPSLTFFAVQLAERTVTRRVDIQPVQVNLTEPARSEFVQQCSPGPDTNSNHHISISRNRHRCCCLNLPSCWRNILG